MKKFIKIIIAIIIVGIVVFVAVTRLMEVRAKNAALPTATIYPIVVKTMVPKVSNVELTLPYLAQVENDRDVKLASRVAARILYIKNSGSSVKKGDVIVRLDTTNLKTALNSLKDDIHATTIALKNLEATHKRTLELLNAHGASIEESQGEQTHLAELRAKISSLHEKEIQLHNDLSYSVIKSPVDGVVAKVFAKKGAMSMPGKPLLDISSKSGFYLLIRTPQDIAIKGVKFNGKVYDAISLGTTYHGLSEYKVYVKNRNLITGDRIEVNVVVFKNRGILLPFDALLNRNGASYVLVADGTHATPLKVNIIQTAQEGVVVSGAIIGKKIVIGKPDILLRLVSGYELKIKE